MKLTHLGSHHRALAEINITPFVDVVLVLLIIFMITAPLLQQGLPVHLPKAASPELKRTPRDVVLTIDEKGRIYLGDSKQGMAKEELAGKLLILYRTKKEKDLLIKADEDIKYGSVIEVMNLAQRAGIERIGMITQPEEGTKE